ncbi:HIT family protein [Candidatus Leptofilum sp.]|uniref:HIT family protein n=1 Tax=Candidatus Leptofilum sp. TaxID=3241576 RepID=UPI003B5CEAC2
MSDNDCLFCAIVNGEEPAKLIAKDGEAKMALIESLHPEGAIHWLAIPFEHVDRIETLARENVERFQALLTFALDATKQQAAENPELNKGFTVKMHVGPFETVHHAKLHILSVE